MKGVIINLKITILLTNKKSFTTSQFIVFLQSTKNINIMWIRELIIITTSFILFFANKVYPQQEIKISDRISLTIENISVDKGRGGVIDKDDRQKGTRLLIIKCLITSPSKNPLDVNSFSLLDTANKKRYRLVGYSAFKGTSTVGFGATFESYLKEEFLNKRGKQYRELPKYDPSVKDSFGDFDFEGYENVEIPIEFDIYYDKLNAYFANGKFTSVVYYPPTSKWKKFLSFLRFPLLQSENNPVFELYYGNKLISKIDYDFR